MLSSYDLLLAGVAFSVFLAGFLAGCALVLFWADNASDDETHRQLGLGGASLADELRRHASGPSPDHIESSFHVRKDDA